MEPLRERDLRRLLDFLRECYVLRDVEGFLDHLVTSIPSLVPSDFTSYTAFTPRELVARISRPADRVSADTDRLFEQTMHENPVVDYHRRTRNGRAVKISDFVTRRQFRRTAHYNELGRRLGGLEHQMAFTFPARPPLVAGVGLNRHGAPDFSERDRLVLDLLRPHLVQAYRNAAVCEEMRADVALVLAGAEAERSAVAILAADGRHVREATGRTREWLRRYVDAPAQGGLQLPDTLRRWVEQLIAERGRTDAVPAARAPLVVERDGRSLTARLVGGPGRYLLLMREHAADRSLQALGSAGLTKRETEVLSHVAYGLTNEAIGSLLGISRRTVQKHLERVFDKLGVETRTAAVARALGLPDEPSHGGGRG